MPDHLHLLIEGEDLNSDLKKFVASYKQATGYYYKQKTGIRLWQINFYEHVLRKEEDTIKKANYIFGNPARKGLIDDYRNYDFLGSFEFDVRKMQPFRVALQKLINVGQGFSLAKNL